MPAAQRGQHEREAFQRNSSSDKLQYKKLLVSQVWAQHKNLKGSSMQQISHTNAFQSIALDQC